MEKLEICCLCDAPTGRAGKYDDSIYGENGDGPYCEECFMWKYKGERCQCPQGSLCEFLKKDDETCLYGKI